MGLESVTYVEDLNELWPLGTDPKSAGDDHLRRIKLALKNTFPNADSAITATPAELNALVGVTTALTTIITPAITAIAPLTPAADKLPYFTGANAAAVTDLTTLARTLLDDANQTAALVTLGALIGAVEAKSATFVVAAADRGKLFDCTGTWTMNLLAASGNSGFAFAVRNSGTGTITVDPSASEQIDGAGTIALAAGKSCLIVCDGTGWKTVGRSATYRSAPQTLTANGLLTLAHGLGAVPTKIQYRYRCASAEGGWGAGDEVFAWTTANYTFQGQMCYSDETNIYVRFSGQPIPLIGHKTTGAWYGPTTANWRLIVEAEL